MKTLKKTALLLTALLAVSNVFAEKVFDSTMVKEPDGRVELTALRAKIGDVVTVQGANDPFDVLVISPVDYATLKKRAPKYAAEFVRPITVSDGTVNAFFVPLKGYVTAEEYQDLKAALKAARLPATIRAVKNVKGQSDGALAASGTEGVFEVQFIVAGSVSPPLPAVK
ncbi:MAG: hypothetical protein K0S08_1857 [Gammaproteobacteria bacterium]|nr:hypothetical protein [Gammaproteobacteria bacterium]